MGRLGGRHFLDPLPGNLATAVVLELTTAGTYVYRCYLPGPRSTTEGTLEVIE